MSNLIINIEVKKCEGAPQGVEFIYHYDNGQVVTSHTPPTSYYTPPVKAAATKVIKPKQKQRSRTHYTHQQIMILEREYRKGKYLNAERRAKIARSIGVQEKQVKYWFQNRRIRGTRYGEISSNEIKAEDKEENVRKIVQFLEGSMVEGLALEGTQQSSSSSEELDDVVEVIQESCVQAAAEIDMKESRLGSSMQPVMKWPQQSASTEELDDIFAVIQSHFGVHF
ncbi:PREDICTED: homeobox protein BarH-like 2 [Rhagoletis zephyria]|uniref:homeobox protein BarH-like 2 n=1 Tax=Rhagoletis zephyria TaxID=28612 RepID=UPI0008113B00|nr:PREDICTED: homeobox protein BarH-like 2 [Rhagoletis zephyria]